MTFRAISLWQPWASLIVLGEKQIETRSWDTPYRGRILIHAAKRQNLSELLQLMGEKEYREAFARQGMDSLDKLLEKMPFGCLIGSADLDATYTTEDLKKYYDLSAKEEAFGNYDPNRFGWRFKDVQQFDHPVGYKGSQGFFTVGARIKGNTLDLLEVQR